MSALGEKVLVQLLSDTDSVAYLAKDGLDPATIPSITMRGVYVWTMKHYRASGQAPTPAVLIEQFGADIFADAMIDPAGDPDETIEWAVGDLKGSYARNEAGTFSREFMTTLTETPNDEKPAVIGQFASQLSSLAMTLQPRTTQVDMRSSSHQVLDEYEFAAAHQDQVIGMGFGLPLIDIYTGGIREGELAFLAGGPATGKSMFLNFVAYQEWLRGRVGALFTLENSILMTQMRIACCALGIRADQLQEGTLPEEDVTRLKEWVHDVLDKSDTPLLIFRPDETLRTPQALIQMAMAHQADSMLVDQLSFLENANPHASKKRNENYYEITRDLRVGISAGRHPMPCLLAHQVNREGVKHAEQTGKVKMYHMADAADVERIGDWVFALYASDENQIHGVMEFQTLKARRRKPQDFELNWNPNQGNITAIPPIPEITEEVVRP